MILADKIMHYAAQKEKRLVPGRTGGEIKCVQTVCIQMGGRHVSAGFG